MKIKIRLSGGMDVLLKKCLRHCGYEAEFEDIHLITDAEGLLKVEQCLSLYYTDFGLKEDLEPNALGFKLEKLNAKILRRINAGGEHSEDHEEDE